MIPRRALIVGAASFLTGCTESLDKRIAKDPYLPAMMEDQRYLWAPSGNVRRRESILPMSESQFASGSKTSSIVLEFHIQGEGDRSRLFKEALQVQARAGYANGKRELSPGGVKVLSNVVQTEDGKGIVLDAPA